MADIFEETRRKISKHIVKNVAEEVLHAKHAEYFAGVEREAALVFADANFKRKLRIRLQAALMREVTAHFRTDEFKARCHMVAKGMLK